MMCSLLGVVVGESTPSSFLNGYREHGWIVIREVLRGVVLPDDVFVVRLVDGFIPNVVVVHRMVTIVRYFG